MAHPAMSKLPSAMFRLLAICGWVFLWFATVVSSVHVAGHLVATRTTAGCLGMCWFPMTLEFNAPGYAESVVKLIFGTDRANGFYWLGGRFGGNLHGSEVVHRGEGVLGVYWSYDRSGRFHHAHIGVKTSIWYSIVTCALAWPLLCLAYQRRRRLRQRATP